MRVASRPGVEFTCTRSICFVLTVNSTTHSSKSPILQVNWGTPPAVRGVGGYSYTVVAQDDPDYDSIRWPDNRIRLGPMATGFTTPPLEPGTNYRIGINLVANSYADLYPDLPESMQRFSEEFTISE